MLKLLELVLIFQGFIWHQIMTLIKNPLQQDIQALELPFATWPDRSDVPRNAARPLRYLDRYVTCKTRRSILYDRSISSVLEGLERGPAGNTSLTAAFALAQEMDEDQIIVVQETEYTGAGKHPMPQLSFAKAKWH